MRLTVAFKLVFLLTTVTRSLQLTTPNASHSLHKIQNPLNLSVSIPYNILNKVTTRNLQSQGDVLDSIPTADKKCNPDCFPYRNDLTCPYGEGNWDKCRKFSSFDNKSCCVCHTKPVWLGQELSLEVEYTSPLGKSLVTCNHQPNTSALYKIIHTGGYMTEFPGNLCNNVANSGLTNENFEKVNRDIQILQTRIVKLDLSDNRISEIADLNCLINLDILNLGHNRIRALTNISISELSRLRELRLEYNLIETIDPNVFTYKNMHILLADLSHNQIKEVDVTHWISSYPFCLREYSHNKIVNFTNVSGFTINGSCRFGPGHVSFSGNQFANFPDFRNLFHMKNFSELVNLLQLDISFIGAYINCDCILEPYLELGRAFVIEFWRGYESLYCSAPKALYRKKLLDIDLDDFICEINSDPSCPPKCNCTVEPYSRTISVECSNTGMTKLPQALPTSLYTTYLSVNFSRNLIPYIKNVSYLQNVSSLDVSNNQILTIEPQAAEMLASAKFINIASNPHLLEIPQYLQYHSTCNVGLEGLILDCDCDSVWLHNWLSVKQCAGNQSLHFQCRVPGHGIMPASEFSTDLLDCLVKDLSKVTLSWTLACVISALIITGILVFFLRYELFIIYLQARKAGKSKIHPQYKFDVFLSFDDDNDDLLRWVNTQLVPDLENKGYRVFLHYRDLNLGDVRASQTIDILQTTKNFVLILSDGYLESETNIWTQTEWKYGWNMYKMDSNKRIILINFDHVSSFDVKQPQIRAFLRVGGQVEFSNRNRNIMEQICRKLRQPCMIKRTQENT